MPTVHVAIIPSRKRRRRDFPLGTRRRRSARFEGAATVSGTENYVCAGCDRPIARTDVEAVDMPPFTFHNQTCLELWLAFGHRAWP